jgi:hypothetical protein
MAIFKNTPPIVTSGLVLSLDAANSRSYISGSTVWRDVSGNNNSGSIVSNPGYDNANGGSLVFKGLGEYVNCGNKSSLDLTALTLSMWFKTTTTTNQVLMGKTHTISYYMNTNNGVFSLWTSGSSTGTSGTNLANGSWHNVVATMTGTTKMLYVDGIFSTSGTGNIPAIDSNELFIGRSATVAIPFSGSISQVQVYNRTLSQAEISQNYNALKSRFALS